MQSTLSILKSIDPKQLYRLFIDGRFYVIENAWERYEKREPGSIEGMSIAYSHMIDKFDISSGLKIEYLCELHDKIILKIKPKARSNRYPGTVRQFRVSFLLKPRTCTVDGLKDLLEIRGIKEALKEAEIKGYKSFEDVYERVTKGEKVRFAAPIGHLPDDIKQAMIDKGPKDIYQKGRKMVQRNITEEINSLLCEYNEKINLLENDEKLYYIIDIVKRLVRLHPFVDANARVFISILLNHLLMFHGFFPTILEEPSIFDGRTTDEILVEVKIGQALVKQLIDSPESKFFGHSINDETQDHHEHILKLMSQFIEKIKILP